MRVIILVLIVLGVFFGGYYVLNQKGILKEASPLNNLTNKVPAPVTKYAIIYSNEKSIKPSFFKAGLTGQDSIELTTGNPDNKILGLISSSSGEYVAKVIGGVSVPKGIEILASKQLDKPIKIINVPGLYDTIKYFVWSVDGEKFAYITIEISDVNKSLLDGGAKMVLYTANKDGSNNTKSSIDIPIKLPFRLVGFDSSKNIVYGVDDVAKTLISIDLSNNQQKVVSSNVPAFAILSFNIPKSYYTKFLGPADKGLFEIDINDGKQRDVYIPEGYAYVDKVKLSPDGKYLVFVKNGDTADSKPELYSLDVAANKMELLLDSSKLGEFRVRSAEWSPDGKYLFIETYKSGLRLISDKTKPVNQISNYYTLNASSKELTPFYQGTTENPEIKFQGWIVK